MAVPHNTSKPQTSTFFHHPTLAIMSGNHYIQNVRTKDFLAITGNDGNGTIVRTVKKISDGAGIFNHKRVEGDLFVIKATTGQMLTVAAPPDLVPGVATLIWKRSEFVWLATQGSPNIFRIRSNTVEAYWSQKKDNVTDSALLPPPPRVPLRKIDSGDDDSYNWEFIAIN